MLQPFDPTLIHLRPDGYRLKPFCEELGVVALYYEWNSVLTDIDYIPGAKLCIACFGIAKRAGLIPEEAEPDGTQRYDNLGN